LFGSHKPPVFVLCPGDCFFLSSLVVKAPLFSRCSSLLILVFWGPLRAIGGHPLLSSAPPLPLNPYIISTGVGFDLNFRSNNPPTRDCVPEASVPPGQGRHFFLSEAIAPTRRSTHIGGLLDLFFPFVFFFFLNRFPFSSGVPPNPSNFYN